MEMTKRQMEARLAQLERVQAEYESFFGKIVECADEAGQNNSQCIGRMRSMACMALEFGEIVKVAA